MIVNYTAAGQLLRPRLLELELIDGEEAVAACLSAFDRIIHMVADRFRRVNDSLLLIAVADMKIFPIFAKQGHGGELRLFLPVIIPQGRAMTWLTLLAGDREDHPIIPQTSITPSPWSGASVSIYSGPCSPGSVVQQHRVQHLGISCGRNGYTPDVVETYNNKFGAHIYKNPAPPYRSTNSVIDGVFFHSIAPLPSALMYGSCFVARLLRHNDNQESERLVTYAESYQAPKSMLRYSAVRDAFLLRQWHRAIFCHPPLDLLILTFNRLSE